MYPNRSQTFPPPNSGPPPPNPQLNAKEVISDLCDRIKSEYSNMYSHIQSLKSELDKATTQRADYERFINLNITYFFNVEIHKMMDVIKRLVQTCVLQVPYLPLEMRNNCLHLIEQVKHYTTSEPAFPFMHHLMVPDMGGSGQPHPHPPHPPNLPPHAMPPPIGPNIHGVGSHQMMGFMPRLPPPQASHHETREFGHPVANEAFRYPVKEPSLPSTSDSAISIHKDRSGTLVNRNSCPVNENTPSPKTSPGSDSGGESNSQKFAVSETKSDKESNGANSNENELAKGDENTEVVMNGKSSKEGYETGNNKVGSTGGHKRTGDWDSTPRTLNSPGKKLGALEEQSVVPYLKNQRPDSHGSAKGPHNNAYLPPHMSKSNMNGSYPGYHLPYPPYQEGTPFHPGSPPIPYSRHPHMSSQMPYDPILHARNSIHHMPPFPMSPAAYPHPPQHHMAPIPHQTTPIGTFPQVEYSETGLNESGSKSNIPQSLSALGTLQHGDVVCAAAFSKPFNYVFTGSKGVVKIWDVDDVARPKLLSSIDCLKDNYVRACKAINGNRTLVVCGEYSSVGIWSLTQSPANGLSVNTVCELNNPAPVCYNMAVAQDERQVYCCCNNGAIVAWDIETAKVVRNFVGHVDGATSIDITRDGSCVWTGGLDATARCWDVRDHRQQHCFTFPTQVFSLCTSPCGSYVVVGLENKTLELCYLKDCGNRFGERNVFKVHDSCVLTCKIANSGRWLISSSKDNYTNCVQVPIGKPLFITRDTASILCTDICPDDRYIVTGSGDKKATIYQCMY